MLALNHPALHINIDSLQVFGNIYSLAKHAGTDCCTNLGGMGRENKLKILVA
jgi:hypothetical protein